MGLRSLSRKDQLTNIVLYLIALAVMPLGVVLTINAHSGACGIDALNFALAERLGLNTSIGIYLTSTVILCIAAFVRRSYPHFQCFLTAFLLGLSTDVWQRILEPVQGEGIVSQVVILMLGLVVSAFAVACYMLSFFPTSANDDLLSALHDTGRSIALSKISFDAVCIVLAFLMHGEIGYGTVICLLCLGPFIDFFHHIFEKLPAVRILHAHYGERIANAV